MWFRIHFLALEASKQTNKKDIQYILSCTYNKAGFRRCHALFLAGSGSQDHLSCHSIRTVSYPVAKFCFWTQLIHLSLYSFFKLWYLRHSLYLQRCSWCRGRGCLQDGEVVYSCLIPAGLLPCPDGLNCVTHLWWSLSFCLKGVFWFERQKLSYERWEQLSAFKMELDRIRAKWSLMAVISLLSSVDYEGKRSLLWKNSSGKIDSLSRRWYMAVKPVERRETTLLVWS